MRTPRPNFTQVPNEFLDDWVHKIDPMEAKVMLVIYRKTFGWHKVRDQISISQLEKCTGHGKQAILKAVKGLIEKGAIRKIVEGPPGEQKTYYEVVMEDDSNNSDPCDFHTPPQCDFHTGGSVIFTPTKETPKEIKNVCIADANGSDKSDKKPEPKEPQKIRSITKQNAWGKDVTISWDDLITYAVTHKKDWRMTEMQEVWKILQARTGYVNDLMEFIAGTISNLRDKTRASYANKEKTKCSNSQTKKPESGMKNSPGTSSSSNLSSSEKGTKETFLDVMKRLGVEPGTVLPPG